MIQFLPSADEGNKCEGSKNKEQIGYSEESYRRQSHQYAEVAHQLLQSVHIRSSHPALKSDLDLLSLSQASVD